MERLLNACPKVKRNAIKKRAKRSPTRHVVNQSRIRLVLEVGSNSLVLRKFEEKLTS